MQPTTGPNKAIAGGTSGAATVIIIWIIGLFGVAVPPEIASAATVLVTTIFTYFVPHGGAA